MTNKSPVDITAVKKFVADYITQSNRITAWPYAYVIQEKQTQVTLDGHGDNTFYGCHEAEWFDYEDENKLEEELKEHDYENAEIFSYDVKIYWEDKQWFFTEAEAELHLNRNGHNYGKTRLYVKPFHRNSEAELILRSLFTIAGEDYDAHRK